MPQSFKADKKRLGSKSLHFFSPIIIQLHVLDRLSSEGINAILPFLAKISSSEFEEIIETLLKESIHVSRIFSDAVEFLSIWLVKSPHTLIERLQQGSLKEFFDNTEYSKDGSEWPFPKLLHAFLPVIETKGLTASVIVDYLFNNFDFLNMPKTFIWEVIGYDQLDQRLKDIPKLFHEPLLEKMANLYHCGNSLGPRSHHLVRLLVRLYNSEKESLWEQQSEGLVRVGKFLNNSSQEENLPLITLSFTH